MSCIICEQESLLKPVQSFATYSVLECPNCKFAIVDPIPSPELLDKLYNSVEYYDTHMAYNFDSITQIEIEKKVRDDQNLHSRNLKNYLKEGQKFLEVGSGGGFALKAFKNLNLDVTGVETSTVAQKFAEKTFNVRVINSSFEDFVTEEKYDIIMLNHVLEHFLDPNQAMEKLKSLLKKDGILYIRVPDHDSYDRRSYKEKWPAYAHYHISNFSEKSLVTLYQNHGLKVLEVKKFISERAPRLLRKVAPRTPFKNYFINKFNGRTISIIGKKN